MLINRVVVSSFVLIYARAFLSLTLFNRSKSLPLLYILLYCNLALLFFDILP
jgi:hypothetical protein